MFFPHMRQATRAVGSQFLQRQKQDVIALGAIEDMETVRPTGDQTDLLQNREFALHGPQREFRCARDLTHIHFSPTINEQRAQHLGANNWKQQI